MIVKKIIPLVVFAGLIVGLYYFVFSKDEWKSETSLSGVFVSEEEEYLKSLNDKDIQKYVFYTLPEKALKPEFGGKVFCSSKVFGYDTDVKSSTVSVYVYAYCEEYYIKNDKPVLGSGVSYPVKLTFKTQKKELLFDSITIPKDGGEYASSIRSMYPQKYQEEAIKGVDVSTLIPLPKTQAENYYKGKLEVYF